MAKLSGYAAIFYDGTPGSEFALAPGLYERIHRGAFANTLKRDIVCAFNHSLERILGRTTAGTLRLSVDNRGLR